MAIREISGGPPSLEPVKEKRSQGTEKTKGSSSGKDKVELSSEARSLFESEQSKRMKEIEARMESGFYLSKEVTEKVVDEILKDLKNSAGT